MTYNKISFRTDSGEVRALLTDKSFRLFADLFDTAIAMLKGAKERQPNGMQEYVFIMPPDERREMLIEFIKRCENHMTIVASLN